MTAILAALRNEARIVLRHPLAWLVLVGATGFSAMVVEGSPADPADGAGAALRWLNLFLPIFVLPFVAGALAPMVLLREVDHDMAGIVGSYPLTPRRWLAMRVGALFALLFLVCCAAQLAFVLLLQRDFPGSAGMLAARSVGWLVLHLAPTCFLWAGLLAVLACRTASSGVLYVAAAGGWIGYLALAALSGSPMLAGSSVMAELLRQAMLLLDPYGATALLSPMPESGPLASRAADLVMGRIFWIGVVLVLLARLRATPAHHGRELGGGRRWWQARAASVARPLPLHLLYVVRDKVFPLLVIGWVVMLLPEVLTGSDHVEPFAELVPTSRDALNRVMWDMVGPIGAVLLLYVADRLCRLYSAARMAELYGATPHRPARLVGVQLAGLSLVAAGFVALAGLSVLAAQLVTGSAVEPGEYGAQMSLVLSRLLVLGMMLVAIHGLIRQRFLANLAGALLVALGSESVAQALRLTHPLWRPATTPLTVPDAAWGYGGSLASHGQLLAFWGTIALAALALAVARHHRTLPFRPARTKTLAPFVAAAVLVLAATVQGVSIDRTLRAEGALVDRTAWRAAYERTFADWMDVPQPSVAAIRSRIDVDPAAQRARIVSELELVNRGAAPIDRVLVGRNLRDPGTGVARLAGATVERRDAALGQTIWRLARPLQPGDRATLRVALEVAQSGLVPAEAPFVLREGFSALPLHELLPVIGFEPRFRLRNPATRRDEGLDVLAVVPPSRLPMARAGSLADARVLLDTTVSTSADQWPVAQGEWVSSRLAGGRRTARFRTREPIHDIPAVFSLPWMPTTYASASTGIRVFAPRRLAADHPTILGTADTLDWLARTVAPYPATTLTLVATPEIGLTGYAYPQIVELSDRVAFRAVPSADAGFSQAYRRAAHEAAHQWFGHLFGHGIVEERAFFVESLAKYAELVMIERRYGRTAMRALVDHERERYRGQRIDAERSVLALIDADDGADMYSRATLAFACLRSSVGDAAIVATLRDLADAQAAGRAVRSVDFVERLATRAPARRATVRRLLVGTEPVDRAIAAAGCGTARE